MTDAILLFGGGLCAGALGGLLGLGGGIVLMPLLRFVVGLNPAHAAGTCIVAVFFTSLGGSYRHLKQGHLDVRSVAPVVVAGTVASGLCSIAFGYVAARGHWLDLGIGMVFCLVSARMIHAALRGPGTRPGDRETRSNVMPGTMAAKLATGVVAGGLPGLLGIGTGGILVPAFTLLLGAPIKTAMAASLTCYSFTAATSSAFKLAQGYVLVDVAVPLSLGAMVGANFGAVMNHRFPSRAVRIAFGVLFAAVALKFLASSIGALL